MLGLYYRSAGHKGEWPLLAQSRHSPSRYLSSSRLALTIYHHLFALLLFIGDHCDPRIGGDMTDSPKAHSLGLFHILVRTIESVQSLGGSSQIRAALAALILTGCASPNSTPDTPKVVSQLDHIDVERFGIITSHKNCDRGAGEPCMITYNFTPRTVTIPAQQGVEFGIGFVLFGSPEGAPVKLRTVWIFAPVDSTSPTGPHRSETFSTAVIGTGSVRTYSIDEPWKLVPAVCTVEIWEGNRRLGSQTFNVIKQ